MLYASFLIKAGSIALLAVSNCPTILLKGMALYYILYL